MTTWTPDPDAADTFSRYRDALTTERDLKPQVQELALAALKDGATITQLAKLTGMTPEVFRRMARKAELPIDERYRERAEAMRKRAAGPKTTTTTAPTPSGPDPVERLSDTQAAHLAEKAFQRVNDRSQFDQLTKAAKHSDRAVIQAALDLGVIDDTDVLIA